MPTINATLSLAKRALLANQGAMGMGADNVANVNTPGYARKRVDMQSIGGQRSVEGSFGGGVDLVRVQGERDQFVERQLRGAMGEAGMQLTSQQRLQMLEEILGEWGDTGISRALDNFWNAWHDLTNDPASTSSRNALRGATVALTDRFHGLDRRLSAQAVSIDDEIATKVQRVNSITEELARLNQDFARANGEAPELYDRRTVLLDELAALANVTYTTGDNGSVTVYLDGTPLVMGTNIQNLGITRDENGRNQVVIVEANNRQIQVRSGEIGALFEVRDNYLQELQERLDNLAVTLAREVNNVHRGGYGQSGSTGINFFDPNTTGAGNIALYYRIEEDVALIAASADGSPGDNQIALAIAELEYARVMNEGTESFGQAYAGINSWLGARVSDAYAMAEGSRLALHRAEAWRESVSGVSLDEEMAQLIRFQLAFNASAKLINMADKMLEAVIMLVR